MDKYCTYLTIYRGNKLPPFYIGSSTVNKILNGYVGSVSSNEFRNIWQSEVKNNKHLFKTLILGIYDTRRIAYQREDFLQRSLNVLRNPLYLNRGYASNTFAHQMSNETRLKISKSKTGVSTGPRSQLTRKRQSAAAKGKRKSAAHCVAMSKSKTGLKQSQETIEKRRLKNIGKTRTEEMRANISAALIGKSQIKNRFGEQGWMQKYSKLRKAYWVKSNTGEVFVVINLEKFCESIGAYSTSFLRTLKSNKPLLFGKFKGWQVLKNEQLEVNEWEEYVRREK